MLIAGVASLFYLSHKPNATAEMVSTD
jgi:hypothetical protein